MSQSGSSQFLKRFDIFKKMPRDLTEPTFCGAMVSIICTFVLITLSIYEIQSYINTGSKAELIIDTSHRDDFVPINIDITFPRMPCDILSLDVQDILGTHKTDVMGELYKKRLNEFGKVVSVEQVGEKNEWRGSIKDRVLREYNEKQGCQMVGYFKVYRVPGNFHIASHPYGDILMMLQHEGVKFDFSHTINHVSFGNRQDFNYIRKNFQDLDIEHPVDGIKNTALKDEEGNAKMFKSMFYLVAVPSYFESGLFKYHVYQLISNYETTYDIGNHGGENIVMFNFEFSPITENVSRNGQSFVEFLISICAIIGGVYTIAGIVDSMIYKSVSYVFKSRIGKLS